MLEKKHFNRILAVDNTLLDLGKRKGLGKDKKEKITLVKIPKKN